MKEHFCQQHGRLAQLPMVRVNTNATQGVNYRPHFFDLQSFGLSRVDIDSVFYNESDAEAELVKGNFSFAYLREDKLRTIHAYDSQGELIPFIEFLNHFHITIESKNLFKTGKYLSRVFRPIRYGGFFQDLDIHINDNHNGKTTDGISLISLSLAHNLGWSSAEAGSSAQFTLFYADGLVKGHCVVSDLIEKDVVIYGQENIKKEIKLGEGFQFVTLESVKLGESLRLDIQSMLNLFNVFGAQQFLSWAYNGIEKYKHDLISGNFGKYLDNFNDIEPSDYDQEQWTLRKAIWHKVDYTRYPGLLRLGWSMFKNSIRIYASNSQGEPVFRIPVSGLRGYLRVDLRNHDAFGSFSSMIERGSVELDKFGNLWIHELDIEEILRILGGGDQDDSVAIIPVENNQAVIFRNPNQYGEVISRPMHFSGVTIVSHSVLYGELPQQCLNKTNKSPELKESSGNKLFDQFVQVLDKANPFFIRYTRENLLRTLTKIRSNYVSIGAVANAEMIRSSIGITNPKLQKKLMRDYSWNLERVIDATIKDGDDASEDMNSVSQMYDYIKCNEIKIPKSLVNRIPERYRSELREAKDHIVDQLLAAINLLIDKADRDIIGSGSVSKGNRIPGIIDRCEVPLIEIGLTAIDNPLFDKATVMLRNYNRQIAIMLEQTKDKLDKEVLRREGIEKVQSVLRENLSGYSTDERSLLVNSWAFTIYKSASAVHDSILWIADNEGLTGTAVDTINMLSNVGEAWHIKKNGTIQRYHEIRQPEVNINSIRVWEKNELNISDFTGISEIVIDNKSVLLGEHVLNMGDENKALANGVYQVREVTPSISRKDSRRILKNSL